MLQGADPTRGSQAHSQGRSRGAVREAAEHFNAPIYGWALRRYGNIPINRKNARESFKSIMEGANLIKSGTSVVILPEGTRSLKPEMGNFKKFPFILAQKAEAPILPFGFSGLWKINNKTSFILPFLWEKYFMV